MQRLKMFRQKLGHTRSYDFTCNTISEKVDDVSSRNQTEPLRYRLGYRHLVTFWCFFYFAMINSHISLVSVAIVAMVNHTHVSKMDHHINTSLVSCPLPEVAPNTTTKPKVDGPFDWDSRTQSYVFGLSAFGYVFTNFFAGRVAEKFGAKRTLLIFDFLLNLCSIISPFAAVWSVYALIVVQTARGFFQGFIIPCVFVMMANWFPRNERGLLSSFSACGGCIGALFSGLTIGWMCDTPSLGWPSAFWITGGFDLLMTLIFSCVFFEVPKNHPYISKEELKYIVGDQETDMSLKRPPTPWKTILTSIPVIALAIGKFGLFWSISHFLFVHPSFMGTVLHLSMTQNGLFNSMIWLTMAVSAVISMFASNWLLRKKYVGVNNLRKGFNSISAFGFSLCFVGVRLGGCDKITNLIFCGLAAFFGGFGYSGSMIASGDMSPKFSGSISGITSSVAASATIIMPLIVGSITKHETLEEWNIVFYIHIAVIFFCGLIFQVFGSAEIQSWNFIESPESKTAAANQPQPMQPVNVKTPATIHI